MYNLGRPRKTTHWTPPDEWSRVVSQVTYEFTSKSFGYDYRDLKQQLWLKVYELNEIPSMEYLAHCLRNEARDFFRKLIRERSGCVSQETVEDVDRPSPVSPAEPLLDGRILKTYLCAYYLHPDGLTVETRDQLQRIWVQLTEAEIKVIDVYAYERDKSPGQRKIMERLLVKHGQVESS